MNLVHDLYERYSREIGKVIVGHGEAVRLAFVALVTEGHLLLEGVPGIAKTTLVRAMGKALQLQFKRVQFTPDLMPSDVLGTHVFDFQKSAFYFVTGPVFTNLLLADEINRAPPKTQAALLEAMQERQVSIEGTGRALPSPFLVLATQNPIEQEGTYRLPEAQLDRFLFKLLLRYPSAKEEAAILKLHRGDNAGLLDRLAGIEAVAGSEDLQRAKEEVQAVKIRDEVGEYLVELIRRTRDHPHLSLGASPRATLLLQSASKALAALERRDYVIPDDSKALFLPTLRHRVLLTPSAEVEGLAPDEILKEILDGVPVPR